MIVASHVGMLSRGVFAPESKFRGERPTYRGARRDRDDGDLGFRLADGGRAPVSRDPRCASRSTQTSQRHGSPA